MFINKLAGMPQTAMGQSQNKRNFAIGLTKNQENKKYNHTHTHLHSHSHAYMHWENKIQKVHRIHKKRQPKKIVKNQL